MLLELLLVNRHSWALCLAGLLLCYIYSRRKLYGLSWQLPGPNPALPLIGNLLSFWGKRVTEAFSLFDMLATKYSEKCGMVRFWLGPYLLVFVYDPGVAYQVNQKTQLKSQDYQYLAKPFLNKGLFLSNDMDHWRQSKKMYLLALSSEHLKSFIPKFHDESLRTVNTLGESCALEHSVHTKKIFSNLAVCCTIKCTMDYDFHLKDVAERETFLESVNSVMEFFQLRLMMPLLRIDSVYSLVGLRAKELKKIHKTLSYCKAFLNHHKEKNPQNKIKKVTKRLQASGRERRMLATFPSEYLQLNMFYLEFALRLSPDFLTYVVNNFSQSFEMFEEENPTEKLFIEHLLDEASQMSEDEMVANVITMIVAATDTLATGCTLLLILLAQNPLVQQKVHDELTQVLGDDATICPSIEGLSKLKYLDRVLKECLRMFPPAPYIARCVSEDSTVTGSDGKDYVIPEGATIVLGLRNIENNPLFFENPNEFDPDRWLPENSRKIPPWSYLPFNNGPRKCVGERYALLQMKTMAATVLRTFEVLTSKSCERFEDIHVQMNMTVEIGHNCQVVFKKR